MEESKLVYDKVKDWKLPFYIEGPSGLRDESLFSQSILKSGDTYLKELSERSLIKSVLRIGSVPTVRFWRDLEQLDLPVTSVSRWSGLSKDSQQITMDEFLSSPLNLHNNNFNEILSADRSRFEKLSALIEEFPSSEVRQLAELSNTIGADSVFIGNSLPIREWDLAASYKK